ncbi:transglutaminase family protein [Acidisoma cellulosilytica]|uniref:Transglutaminase family protein n=1 Tax=Acidisoma cellulosilyticum TaxID=2802395 RepID=A0A964E6W6_9PROT|nr:transglutaminase family protein [Acidisoma cellulosilyticum]MCB8883428.1 transglutaminase family protein [Acidisoma cellulosilyticum]
MVRLNIRHRTTYHYNRNVSLRPHRLMLRPRESRELRLLGMEIIVNPDAVLTWAQDVAGNSVASLTFRSMTNQLVIESIADIELDAVVWPVFDISASAIFYPFHYTDDDQADLGLLASPRLADAAGKLRAWVSAFVRTDPTDTLALLKDINFGILSWISYQERDDEGTQSPVETLERGWGACRDLALLFVEAVRTLGFGARIVSGYLHNPSQEIKGSAGAGTTHAWAEVYLPGAGWITFDPTNRSMGGANLIPVAVGRDIRQVMPVIGEFIGLSDAFSHMTVEVCVIG